MEKIFENFTITILKLNKLVQKIKCYEMRQYGLKAIHVMCLYFLNEHSDGATAAELAKWTLEDKAAISRALELLREKNYVQYDLKKYNSAIKLTEEGKKIAAFVTERAESAVEAGSAILSEDERLAFYSALGSIADNLNNYYNSLIKDNEQ